VPLRPRGLGVRQSYAAFFALVVNQPGLRDFVFPLSSGTASLKIPVPIEEEDFDFLLETLNLWKKKLIKQSGQ